MSIARKLSSVKKGPEGAWDLSFAYSDDPFAWDISTASYSQNFSVASQEASPVELFFKPDGLKMYVLGSNGQDVNEYDLSTAWDVSTASYSQNFSVASQEAAPRGLFFKPDGTKMYIVGSSGDAVNEYDLSTAWDISTASYSQNFSVSAQEVAPYGVFFRPDGFKMYVSGAAEDNVNEYDLSTAWDISTASFLQSFSVSAQDGSLFGLFFRDDGLKMYVVGSSNDSVYEYDLSTAWDISTASYVHAFDVTGQESAPYSVFIKPDGLKMYVVGLTTNDAVYEYTLGGFDVSSYQTDVQGLSFKPDGTKMYIVGSSNDSVNEFDLSSPWDMSTASFLQQYTSLASSSGSRDLFFREDGLKLYVCGESAGDFLVYEYDLSTAWDVSTISSSGSKLVQSDAIGANAPAVSFKPDGTKMYVATYYFAPPSSVIARMREYDLTTAWDVTTATEVSTSGPYGLGYSFKPDGTVLFEAGSTIASHTLSTPWDSSTATLVHEFDPAVSAAAIFTREDGTRMFTAGSGGRVYTYTLGPQ